MTALAFLARDATGAGKRQRPASTSMAKQSVSIVKGATTSAMIRATAMTLSILARSCEWDGVRCFVPKQDWLNLRDFKRKFSVPKSAQVRSFP